MEIEHPLKDQDEKNCSIGASPCQVDDFVFVEKDQKWEGEMETKKENLSFEEVESLFHKLESDFSGWILLRKETIFSLRMIADYIDTITTRSSMLKAVGSGTGVVLPVLLMFAKVLTN